ncbi:MAG: hypothetical protein OXU34_02330, partial [Gammaproteobacteria bacterium]|nr:hypothetical protein [Gammaproteobacteria bacterium]
MMTVRAQHARKKRHAAAAPLSLRAAIAARLPLRAGLFAPLFLRAGMVAALLLAPVFDGGSQVFGQTAPTVNPGNDRTVAEESEVVLRGTVTNSGGDTSALTYRWVQVNFAGSTGAEVTSGDPGHVMLGGATGTPGPGGVATAAFTAPAQTDPASTDYYFRLVGTAGGSAVTSGTVVITVNDDDPPALLPFDSASFPATDDWIFDEDGLSPHLFGSGVAAYQLSVYDSIARNEDNYIELGMNGDDPEGDSVTFEWDYNPKTPSPFIAFEEFGSLFGDDATTEILPGNISTAQRVVQYTITATGTDSVGNSASTEYRVIVRDSDGVPEPVIAGGGRTVNAAAMVALNAGGSLNGGGVVGTDLSYVWTQTTGEFTVNAIGASHPGRVSLNNASSHTVTFTAPSFTEDTTLYFRLVATDDLTRQSTGTGSGGRSNAAITVRADSGVRANTGFNQQVAEDSTVTLSGTVSGSGTLTYEWAQVNSADLEAALVAGGIELTGSTGTPGLGGVSTATFTAPTQTTRTTYYFRLVGADAGGVVSTDTVEVTVSDDDPPTLDPYDSVSFPATDDWIFLQDGFSSRLFGSGIATAQVSVYDSVARNENNYIELGMRGRDPERDSVTYVWDYNPKTPEFSHFINRGSSGGGDDDSDSTQDMLPGDIPVTQREVQYTITVTVTDSVGNSASAEYRMNVRDSDGVPDLVIADGARTVDVGATVTLDASGTLNGGGMVGTDLSYAWSQTTGEFTVNAIGASRPERVSLNNASSHTATFTAPSLVEDTTLYFRLAVTDDLTRQSTNTGGGNVAITVRGDPSLEPAAVSGGGDRRVNENSAVTLNGVVNGGGVLAYEWAQVASTDAGAALVVGGFELTGSTGTPAANGAAMVSFNVSTATDRRGNGVRDLASDRYFFRLTGRSTTSGETTVATDTVAVTVYPPRALYVTGGYPSIDAHEGDTFSAVLYRRDGVHPAAGIRLPFGAGTGPSRGADCPAEKEGGSAPQDFRFAGGQSQFDGVIQPNDDSITRNYAVVDDNIPENTECLGFGFALHNNTDGSCCGSNWIIEYEEGFIQNARINDNDTITVGWQTTAVTVGEGVGTAMLTAVITDPAAGDAIERDDFMLRYDTADGSAASPGDYTAVVSGMATFGANLRNVTIPVPVIDDSVLREFSETFTVRISTASSTPLLTAIAASNTATVTIEDNDFPTPVVGITPNRASFSEGDTDAEFTITLTGGNYNSAVVVNFQVTGTAITTDDYDITLPAGIGAMASMGTLTLMTHSTDTEANPVNGMIRLTISEDIVREEAETLEIAVWTAGSEVSRTSVGIAADPVADRFLSFGAATADGAEGGAEIAIPVVLTGLAPTGGVRVAITAAAGAGANPAEAGDYTLLTPTLTFSATGTQNVRLRIEQDNVNESTETVLVSLGAIEADGGGGGTVPQAPDSVTVSIAQNDAITYSIAGAPDPATEGGEVRFTLSLSAPSEGDVSVALGASSGGMLNGRPSLVSAEFSGVPAGATVPAGASSTEFRVSLVDDSLVEADESLGLLPGNITRTAQAGTVSAAGGGAPPIVRITDNDDAYYTIAAADGTAVEGGDARFSVRLVRQSDGGAVTAPGDVVVPWTAQVGAQGNTGDANTQAQPDLTGGTGAAGAALSGQVTIAAGQSEAMIALPVNSDQLAESTETLTVTLGTPPTRTAETGVVDRSPDDNAAQVTIAQNTAASRILSVARISGGGPLQESGAGA